MSDVAVDGAAPAAPAEAVVATTPADTMAAVYEKLNPHTRVERETTGQFKAKDAPEGEAPEAAPAETEITKEPVAETKEPAKAEAKPATPRPQSWSSDLDEFWNSLPPERQEFLAKRETEAQTRLSELGRTAKAAEQYQAIIDRYRHVLNGSPPEREIESLLATKDQLLRHPKQSIEWLAQQLGVDLSQYGRPADEQPKDASTAALEQQIVLLQRQLHGLTNNITAREQRERETQTASLAKMVEDFSKGKDHWPEVEGEVAAQITAIRAQDPNMEPSRVLELAHERAVKLNEEVSNRLNKAKREEEAKKKEAEEKRKAEEAKRLASLNVKSAPGPSANAKKGVREQMEEVYDRLQKAG